MEGETVLKWNEAMKTPLMAVLVLTVALACPVAAGEEPSAGAKLAGLSGVFVAVEEIRADAERDGLFRSTLQTDVELKLRQAGVRVLTEAEASATPGRPWLYLTVATYRGRENIYAYSIRLALLERAIPVRNPTISLGALTWRATGKLGLVGAENLSQLREPIRDTVDQFINAYLEANPKR